MTVWPQPRNRSMTSSDPGIEPIGERVIHQIRGHRQQMDVLRMLDPIALQGPEVVAVAQLVEQLLEDRPVAIAAGRAEFAFEMTLQIGLDAVVVEQCVVDVDKEDGLVGVIIAQTPRWLEGIRCRATMPLRLEEGKRFSHRPPLRCRPALAPFASMPCGATSGHLRAACQMPRSGQSYRQIAHPLQQRKSPAPSPV